MNDQIGFGVILVSYQRKSKSSTQKNFSFVKSRYFCRNALLFAKLLLFSAICFGLGYLGRAIIGTLPAKDNAKSLHLCFSDPFFGCNNVTEWLLRLLLYATPALIGMLCLLLSLAFKDRQKALYTISYVLQGTVGFKLSALSAICESGDLPEIPPVALFIYQSTEIFLGLLFCIYTYRLTLCLSRGLTRKNCVPGTPHKFISFTARLLLWIFILILIRFGLISLF